MIWMTQAVAWKYLIKMARLSVRWYKRIVGGCIGRETLI